jgi:hypothetical protein
VEGSFAQTVSGTLRRKEMPTIMRNMRSLKIISETLHAYFYSVQFFDTRTNWLDIDVFDFILWGKKVKYERTQSMGHTVTYNVYEVDIAMMTNYAHEKYWGLFPSGFLDFRRNKSGKTPVEFAKFIAEAKSHSISSRTFDVFGYFNRLKEKAMKKIPNYAAYKNVFPADITNHFYESINGNNSAGKKFHYICIMNTAKKKKPMNTAKKKKPMIKWRFDNIEHRRTETRRSIDIYIAFEYYCRLMLHRSIIGKNVSDFINGPKKSIPLLGSSNMDLETFLTNHKEINCLYYNTDNKTIELQYREKDSLPLILDSVLARTLQEYNEAHYCYFKVRYKTVFREDPFLLKSGKFLQISDAFFATILQELHPKIRRV